MICRGLGFLAVLYDPAPRPPPSPFLPFLFLSLPVSSLLTEEGEGVGVEPNHSLYLHRLTKLCVMKTYPRVLKASCRCTLQRWMLTPEL